MSDYAALLENMMQALLAGKVTSARTLYRDKADFSSQEQLRIYVHGYRSRLHKIIGNLYPVTRYYLGEKNFKTSVDEFIHSAPSRHYNIDTYAVGFGIHIAGTRQDMFLSDLAYLESTLRDVYHWPETPPLNTPWLKQQTPERLTHTRLHLRAASCLVVLRYPVSGYMTAFHAGRNPKKPEPAPAWIMVLRDRDEMLHVPLEQAEHLLLTLVAEGHTLGAALASERFAPHALSKNLAGDFQKWFARWIHEGFLSLP